MQELGAMSNTRSHPDEPQYGSSKINNNNNNTHTHTYIHTQTHTHTHTHLTSRRLSVQKDEKKEALL